MEVRERLGDDADAWDRLADSQPLPSAFSASWWVQNSAAGQPCLLICRRGERLVGGLAMEYDWLTVGPVRVPRLRMAGQGVLAPDHLDLLADQGSHGGVARALLGWLRRPGSRVVDLDGLAAGGTLATVLAPWEVDRTPAPTASLAGGADVYMADRPGRLRSTVSRTRKRLDRDGATIEVVDATHTAALDEALAALADLHDHRWAEDSAFLRAWPRFAAAARVGVAEGRVSLHLVRAASGEVVAVELDVHAPGSVAFYQAGRRTEREWRGVGSVLRAEVVRAAAAAGSAEYDMLRGDEPYKADWATSSRAVTHVRMGVGPLGRAAVAAIAARPRATAAVDRLRRAARPDEEMAAG